MPLGSKNSENVGVGVARVEQSAFGVDLTACANAAGAQAAIAAPPAMTASGGAAASEAQTPDIARLKKRIRILERINTCLTPRHLRSLRGRIHFLNQNSSAVPLKLGSAARK